MTFRADYVPDTFVFAAPATAALSQDRAQRDPEGARLLGLLRTLLVLGRTLLGTLQALGAARPPIDIARRFRCLDLSLIIARVTRGLLIAEALEARLLRRRPRLVPVVPRPMTVRTPAAPRRPRRSDAEDDAERSGALPTAEQIAARIRRRAIGAVFVDICRDLGLNTSHPDWREIQKAIVFNGGSMVTMLRHWTRHLAGLASIEQLAEAASQVQAQPQAALRPAVAPNRPPVVLAPIRMPDLLASTALASAVVPTGSVTPLFRHPPRRFAAPARSPGFGPPVAASALPP